METKWEFLLLYVPRQPAPNLRHKSCGLILLDQRDSFLQSRRQVTAQADLGAQGVRLRSAYEVESVFGLRGFLAKSECNRFKQSFPHGTSPGSYWAAPAEPKQPGMTPDLSILLESMSIIVAPDLTVEQAAFQ